MTTARVPWQRKAAYGMPAFALAVVGIPIYVYIPKFYSDVVGINIAVMGVILLAVRLFDAVSDPLIGVLSDRTRTRFGRRRPYIFLGGFAVALSIYLLFTPPADPSENHTVWFGVSIFALFLFWTIVTVPYESLGPEITFDYNERTSLFAVRDGLLIAGTLAAAASPAIIGALFATQASPEGERRKFFWLAVCYAPILISTCAWCTYRIRELPAAADTGIAKLTSLQGLRSIAANRPFLILLAAYTISAIGSNLPATLILYYVEYVLQSSRADLFLMLYFVTGVLFLPAWIRFAGRYGKKPAWLISMAINTGVFLGVFFLGPGDELIYGILVVGSGLGFGATLAIPSAIQADVIDYDELLTGKRREGLYIGIWSIAKKLAAAVGVGTSLAFLGQAGYEPNVEQSASVVLTLRVLYALVPCLCSIAGLAIALAYPLDAAVHRSIREGVARRQQGHTVGDPLRPGRTIG
ncbi:MAG: glycoside-pentoside-hexuronide (GPH):cation symporter [Desulfobacterales bacterium]|jgi:GPH family glycoside/pentoside/hexuronide:cation symporter